MLNGTDTDQSLFLSYIYQSQIAIITGSGNTLISILNANGGAEALIDDLQIVHLPSDTTVVQSGFEAPSTAGSFVYHPAFGHHYDGAHEEDAVVRIVGMGPVKTVNLEPAK